MLGGFGDGGREDPYAGLRDGSRVGLYALASGVRLPPAPHDSRRPTHRLEASRATRRRASFSKKVENLRAAVALHFAHYNFVRVHQTLKTTPALAAGVASRRWSVAELVELPY